MRNSAHPKLRYLKANFNWQNYLLSESKVQVFWDGHKNSFELAELHKFQWIEVFVLVKSNLMMI